MNWKRLLCGALLLMTAGSGSTVYAQLFRSTSKVGTTAAQFLKIGVGARAQAMGGAHAAVLGDVSSLYWNPGALARLEADNALIFNHANWIADISYDFGGGVLRLGDFGTLGFSVTSLRVPDEIVRTVEHPEGDGRVWDASSLALGVTFAKNLTDQFSLGVTMKLVRENLWAESAQTFAFDIGTMYVADISGLTMGASISNFGGKMQLSGRDLYFNNDPNADVGSGPNEIPAEYRANEFDLPLTFRIGLAMEVFKSSEFRTTVALDAVHPNDNTEYLNGGAEVAWREILFGRVGYKSWQMRNSEEGLTWGLGLQYAVFGNTMMKVDYGFADFGRLKNVQHLTFGLTF